ncbi:MAG: alpha/beta hydrolase family protein, partial [Chloroflexota bacterium]
MTMPTERVRFTNRDGVELAAVVERPSGASAGAWALFAHCFTCSKDLRAARTISQALAAQGFSVMRFDFTGLGESEGDFSESNFSSNVSDLVDAARYLEENEAAPSVLAGHSLGGAAVLKAAGEIPSAKAVATIAAPAEPEHVTKLLRSSREEIERSGEAEVELAGRRFCFKRQFLDDIQSASMEEAIASLRRALLIFHSPVDEIVGVSNA